MEFCSAVAEDDLKVSENTGKQLCRCCLTTEKRMFATAQYAHYFLDLANIDVTHTDGLPQWICYECYAIMEKAIKFKYKMLKAQQVLNEYLTRCAPFTIDADDSELAKYASPNLIKTLPLAFDLGHNKSKEGFHKTLTIEKCNIKSELDKVIVATATNQSQSNMFMKLDDLELKSEGGFSDFDDDLPLEELRSTSITQDDLDNFTSIQTDEDIKREPDREIKKKKKKKDVSKKNKKRKHVEETIDDVEEPKKTVRQLIEIDPNKIRVIMLNPQEQIKQREEESKACPSPFQCQLCFKNFNFETKLQNHMKKHSPSRGPYECRLCSMYLPTAYSFRVHSFIHTRRYECVKCGIRMIDKFSILHHYRTEHDGITTLFKCDVCGKESTNSKTHRGHMKNHHSGERMRCDRCSKTFINKDSLAEHMQVHEGVKNFECSDCGKRFRTRTQIKNHQMMHSEAKDYYCVECNLSFKTARYLGQHFKRSSRHMDKDSLKFACALCEKRFPSAQAHEAHVRVRHEGARPWGCACGARLASRAALRKHRATVHGPRPARRHQCHYCPRLFSAKSVLLNHIRTHTGEKPFVCGVCQRAFTQRAALFTHVNMHRRKDALQPKQTDLVQVQGPIIKDMSCLTLFPKSEPETTEEVWPRMTESSLVVTSGPSKYRNL